MSCGKLAWMCQEKRRGYCTHSAEGKGWWPQIKLESLARWPLEGSAGQVSGSEQIWWGALESWKAGDLCGLTLSPPLLYPSEIKRQRFRAKSLVVWGGTWSSEECCLLIPTVRSLCSPSNVFLWWWAIYHLWTHTHGYYKSCGKDGLSSESFPGHVSYQDSNTEQTPD